MVNEEEELAEGRARYLAFMKKRATAMLRIMYNMNKFDEFSVRKNAEIKAKIAKEAETS